MARQWAGLSGQSSGGHLAALVAMRPGDPRYSEIVVEGESGVDGKVDPWYWNGR
jgi:acetyl esterase/lipase